jgi:uncharacterized protein
MRVFLDTNVLVSAVATPGLCADVLREILVSHQLVVCAALIAELRNVLHNKFAIPYELISDFVEVLTQDSILSENTKLTNIDINDEDDILILYKWICWFNVRVGISRKFLIDVFSMADF